MNWIGIRRAASCGAWLFASAAFAGDWTAWRGPTSTGAYPGPAPVTSWTQDGANQIWKAPLGGRTCPVVHNGRVFLIGPVGEGPTLGERTFCLDAATGALLWENRFNVFHTDIVENRVGWTAPAVDPETGNVYFHATGGELLCYNRDGKLLWSHSLTEEFGRFTGYGGRIYTPLVDEGLVIIGMVTQGWTPDTAQMGHRFVAFDKRSGEVVWTVTPGGRPLDTTYSTPVVAEIAGRRLLIAPYSDGWVYGLLVRTGETVWKYHLAERPINVSPVVSGNRVYVGHSEENFDTTVMGRVVCFDGARSGEIDKSGEFWRVDGLDAGYATPLLANDRLYVLDNSANLTALNAETGARFWTQSLGRIARGSPIASADGVIYVPEQNGNLWILRDAGDRCEVLDQETFAGTDASINEIQGSPAIANRRLYFQTRYATYCVGNPTPAPAAAAAATPQSATETEPAPGDLTFHVIPSDVTLAPGEKVQFQLAAFRKNGELAGKFMSQEPRFEVKGVRGTMSSAAPHEFTAAADGGFSAGTITVQWVGEKPAVARVRVAPKPPISEDFEAYALDANPPGWINTLGKTKIKEIDGGKVLSLQAERPTPTSMRVRTYFGPTLAGGYTIEADVKGLPRKQWKPDIGVVNSRYEMLLLGSEPTLRLTTWPAIPRLQKDVPFDWKTDVWYRMKLEVKLDADRALVRGKVWPREESEPSAWTIEYEDPFPNREGVPALYGYSAGTTDKSKGTEILWDNVKITQ